MPDFIITPQQKTAGHVGMDALVLKSQTGIEVSASGAQPKAIMLNPNQRYTQQGQGVRKPSPISFDTLRRISKALDIARVCINTMKHEITQLEWGIVPIDPKKPLKNPGRLDEVASKFRRPNGNGDTFRTLLDGMLEDLLVLDAVALEIVNRKNPKYAEFYNVDAATIRPRYDKYGRLGEPAYVQYLPLNNTRQPDAEWSKEEMIYFMQNPQKDIQNFGYGLSPLEGVIMAVTNMLNSENYNGVFFENGAMPSSLIYLGDNIQAEQVEAFKAYWEANLAGKPHKNVFTGGSKPEVIDMQKTNKDMQFMEYQMWLLKIIVAAYEMSPQDIGFTMDINKAVGEVQANLSKSQGFRSILSLLKENFNQAIIWEVFGYTDLTFNWQDLESNTAKEAAEIAKVEIPMGARTVNEYRKDIGLDPVENGDRPYILTGGGVQFLDSIQDAPDGAMPMDGVPPTQQQPEEEVEPEQQKKSIQKSITLGEYSVYVDDRCYDQPFVMIDDVAQSGWEIHPPLGYDYDAPYDAQALSLKAEAQGVPVAEAHVINAENISEYLANPAVLEAFEEYQELEGAFDSLEWRRDFGGSRKFTEYLVIEHVEGRRLNDPVVIELMRQNPALFMEAVADMVTLRKFELANNINWCPLSNYVLTPDNRVMALDYRDQYFLDMSMPVTDFDYVMEPAYPSMDHFFGFLADVVPALADYYARQLRNG